MQNTPVQMDRASFLAWLEGREETSQSDPHSLSLRGDVTILDRLYIRSPANNALVPLSTFAKWTTVPIQPLSVSHQSQFPAITLSFNLAPGVALGDATTAIQQAAVALNMAPTVVTGFQGNPVWPALGCQAVAASSTPLCSRAPDCDWATP